MNERFAHIRENRNKLDACPRHSFNELPETFGILTKVECKRCGGLMGVLEANQYARGFEAAGGNPDEVIPNFKGGLHANESVTCPVCNGVCGVDVAINVNVSGDPQDATHVPDWHDCDFCDATGKVERVKALAYLVTETGKKIIRETPEFKFNENTDGLIK